METLPAAQEIETLISLYANLVFHTIYGLTGVLLTPSQAEVLKGIGLSLSDYAAYTVAFTLATIVVCLVVSTLIVWRRPDDRMAVLVALMLVTLGTLDATSTVAASSSPWRVPAECLAFLALA